MRMPNLSLPPPAAAAPLDEGQVLGVWRLQKPLPDGEQAHAGQWYSAHHALATEQKAAVLVLDRSDHGAGVMLRYADQAGDLARLQHPQIAVPSDSGVTPDAHPYLIVEGEHGEPLLPRLDELGLRERVELLVQLCEALRSAHQQGWLLAELDPAMIWLDREGGVRLMGLGLTRIPDPTDPFDRGLSLGASPAFVAPERRHGEPPSLASEVYGLGAFARGLVCGWENTPRGLAPLRGSAGDAWPTLREDRQMKLDNLLRRAMAESPELRTRGAEGLADELREWLGLSPQRNALPGAEAHAPAKPVAWWKRWLWLGAAAGVALAAMAARLSGDSPATAATASLARQARS